MKDEPWTPLDDSYPGEIRGNGHCISHVNIQSASLAAVFSQTISESAKHFIPYQTCAVRPSSEGLMMKL